MKQWFLLGCVFWCSLGSCFGLPPAQGEEVFHQALRQWDKRPQSHFRMSMTAQGRKQVQEFWYQAPGRLRVQQKEGPFVGATAVYDPARPEVVMVNPGKWFLPSLVQLGPTAQQLQAVTGDRLPGSDVGNLLRFSLQVLRRGDAHCRWSQSPQGQEAHCRLTRALQHPTFALQGTDEVRFYFDTQIQLTKLVRLSGGVPQSQIQWEWLPLDASWPKHFFQL